MTQEERARRPMRRGIADPHRRAEMSRKAAERYRDAFASLDPETTREELIRRLGQPGQGRGRRVRAPGLFGGDSGLPEAISRSEFDAIDLRWAERAQPAALLST